MTARCVFTPVPTPFGVLFVAAMGDALVSAHFDGQPRVPAAFALAVRDDAHALLDRARAALADYVRGAPVERLPLAPAGTPFQQAVWAKLRAIPAGSTCSYQDVARGLGAPRSVRAVGAAIGRNPLAIFIPCHRVIGARGALTGYAGGLDRKRALLDFERGRATPGSERHAA